MRLLSGTYPHRTFLCEFALSGVRKQRTRPHKRQCVGDSRLSRWGQKPREPDVSVVAVLCLRLCRVLCPSSYDSRPMPHTVCRDSTWCRMIARRFPCRQRVSLENHNTGNSSREEQSGHLGDSFLIWFATSANAWANWSTFFAWRKIRCLFFLPGDLSVGISEMEIYG